MDYELVEAVDGRIMSKEEIDRLFDNQRFLYRREREAFPAEIGCTLSHRECYRRLLKSKEEVALILEDDVHFLADEKQVKELIGTITGLMNSKPCVFTFTRHLNYYVWGKHQVGQYNLCRVRDALGTCAYLINRKAAMILLDIKKPYFVADDFLLMNENHIKVHSIYPMLAIDGSQFLHEVPSLIFGDWKSIIYLKIPLYYKIQKAISKGYRRLLYITGLLRKRKYENSFF